MFEFVYKDNKWTAVQVNYLTVPPTLRGINATGSLTLTLIVNYMVADLVGCTHRPCLNGGTCTDSGISYTCKCVVGYDGWNCENSRYITEINWDEQ